MHIWNQKNVYAKWKSFMHSVKYIMHGNNCWFQLYPFVFLSAKKPPKKQMCIFEIKIVPHKTNIQWMIQCRNLEHTGPKCLHRRHSCWLRLTLHPLKATSQTWATQGSRPLSQIHLSHNWEHKKPQRSQRSKTKSNLVKVLLSNSPPTKLQLRTLQHVYIWATAKGKEGRHLHLSWSCPTSAESSSFQHLYGDRQTNWFLTVFFVLLPHLKRFLSISTRMYQKMSKFTKKKQKKIDEIRRNNWFLDVFFGFSTKFDEIRRRVLRCFALKNTSLFFKSLLS